MEGHPNSVNRLLTLCLQAAAFIRPERQVAHLILSRHLPYLPALLKETASIARYGERWSVAMVAGGEAVISGIINNLYRPAEANEVKEESCSLVLGDLATIVPRFREIAVQEWWNLVAPKGHLLLWLVHPATRFADGALTAERALQLCSEGVLRFRKRLYFRMGEIALIEKRRSIQLGDMDQWTFGIVTNGKRPEWLQESIESIRRQGVPDYEILVVGPRQHLMTGGGDLRVIDFTEKDELGWISRKKNLIAGSAQHENLAIMHDRIVLDQNWYEGMRAYGNYFWLLGVPVESSEGHGRNVDWVRYDGHRGVRQLTEIELLDYEDWDPFVFVNGGFLVTKRSCWTQIALDERLFWQQNEDVWFSRAFIAQGWLPRMNPFAKAWSKTFYPTRIALHLRPRGRRRRVATPWSRFSRGDAR